MTSSATIHFTKNPTKTPAQGRPEYSILLKGFEVLPLAATFIGAIQSGVMTITINTPRSDETIPIRAINTLFLGGLILDIMAACLSYLTARWLQRLSDKEQQYLEDAFERDPRDAQKNYGLLYDLFIRALAMSLFIPMPLLVIGIFCMLIGLLIYAWTQHTMIVAILVTIAYAGTLPFVAGVFLIGKDEDRRKAIIDRLSTMQGDW